MIYTVTLNPSLDYIVTAESFETGRINRTASELILPGGKGINVSFVLKELGEETTALGLIAGFTGREIRRLLKEAGIREEFIPIDGGFSRINVKLVSGEETELNGRGPEVKEEDLLKLKEKLALLKEEDILVLSGSLPKGAVDLLYRDLLETVRTKKVLTVLDTTGEKLLSALPSGPFLIKPNEKELGDLFGVTVSTKKEAVELSKRLQEKGARNVLTTFGKEGAVLLTEDGTVYSAKAPAGKCVSSIGAGDSAVAGFLHGFLHGGDYAFALRTAVASGSATAFTKRLAGKEEIGEVMKRVEMIDF